MKKVYTAPKAYVEFFELSEHIASCGDTTVGKGNDFGKPNHYSAYSCEFVFDYGAGVLFIEGNDNCGIKADPENMEDYCYNTPNGINSVFAS